MTGGTARLTVHFGERARSGGEALADRLMSTFEDGGLASAVLLRGGEGFGAKHGLRTSGQLTLSEDLPMVAIAFDSGARIEAVAGQVRALLDEGLVTVESVQASGAAVPDGLRIDARQEPGRTESSRLTVWTGRHTRIEGVPAHVRLVGSFKENGMTAAIALPGVDGLADGFRHRAGFFSANRSVPMLIVGVGSGEAVASAGTGVSRLLPEAIIETLDPGPPLSSSAVGPEHSGLWRLSVYGGGAEPRTGIRRQRQIVRMLRARGAPGATAYFGLYGFLGDERPHGDSIHSLRRRVPVLTEVIDTAENCRACCRAVEELAGGALVTTVSPVESLSRPAGPA